MKCPKCNATLKADRINVQTDIGQCVECNSLFKISENFDHALDNNFDLNKQPKRTWVTSDYDTTVIGASTRSPIAFFLVPFMLVWSGGSLGGIYGSQYLSGEFDLVLSLFGIPFILGTVFFWGITLLAIWGKVEVTMNNQGGTVFTGIGKLGIKKTFVWSDVATLKEKLESNRYRGSQVSQLVFEGKKRVTFGSGLNEEKRYFMLNALKSTIIKNRWNKNLAQH